MLGILMQRTGSPVELSKELGLNLGVVAYHVRTLASLGLVELVDERPVRGTIEHRYRARPPSEAARDVWTSPPSASDDPVEVVDALLDDARDAGLVGGFDGAQARVRYWTARLDAAGYAALARACTELHDQALRIAADAEARLDADAESHDVRLALLSFEATPLTGGPDRRER